MTLDILIVPSNELTRAQSDQISALCSAVFRCDYAFYMNLDLPRVHVLGYVGERLVAHALWLTRRLRTGTGPWLQAAYVEGVATHADFRQRGYGSTLMRRLQGRSAASIWGRFHPARRAGISGSGGSVGRGRCSSSRMARSKRHRMTLSWCTGRRKQVTSILPRRSRRNGGRLSSGRRAGGSA